MSSSNQPTGDSRAHEGAPRGGAGQQPAAGDHGASQGAQTSYGQPAAARDSSRNQWGGQDQPGHGRQAVDTRGGQGVPVVTNQYHPYAQPAGRWEYVPGGPEDAQRYAQASKSADTSLVLGILAVTVLPILAPFAVWQASKAEKLGGRATPGKVLGWVGVALLVLGLLWIGFVLAMWGVMFSEFQQSMNSSV
ncbi:DUF4190 domain-containing protein [Kocuria tytonis]|uniref:DUF4190 domain-containing protein n=1 Tax=Kocuria tytonis TaxID=2054280 RepID=UPI001F19800A|nr:DUF4190 domain-containing protein [Kocuria tytonis]